MREFLEKTFKLTDSGTDIRTEVRGGAVTFMTMAYILVVNPTILAETGMDKGALFTATALSAALAVMRISIPVRVPPVTVAEAAPDWPSSVAVQVTSTPISI